MKTRIKIIAGVSLVALSACGGGSDDGGEEFIVSDGLLLLELPTEAERAGLDEELAGLLTDIETINTTGELDTAPAGGSIYEGTFGAILDEGGELLTGDVTITVNSAVEVSTLFDEFEIDDGSDAPPSLTGSFGGNTALSNGLYSGGLSGTITVAGTETYDVGGDLDGAFATGGETIGQIEGFIQNQADADDGDTFGALYYAVDP